MRGVKVGSCFALVPFAICIRIDRTTEVDPQRDARQFEDLAQSSVALQDVTVRMLR